MRILIAGATGLIGKQLVAECLKERIAVNYLTTSKKKIESQENYQGFYWNPSKGEIDTNAFEGVITIINLAGASVSKRWTPSHKRAILNSRSDTAKLLFNTLQEIDHTVSQYISASGISIYPSSLNELYTEDSPKSAKTFLGKVVKVWEASADAFEELGIKVTKVRTGIVLAREEGALPKLVQPIKKGFGAPLGSGEQWQSWIHLKDIACIYMFLLKNDYVGVFNAVSPNPATNKKMTQIIAQIYEKDLWLPNVPKFVLQLVLGSMSQIVLESQLVSAEKIQEAGFEFQYVNLENALNDLL
ncbi:MAG: TIGR01777 family protein [Alteromonas sp.]|nr:TIGR01777 family protein [Alteromonas sp.]MAY23712.1 TIGR01777 family protein [Flavobacteriaceae bacterium]|tara:strand:- start:10145 stop:11047 length:903 start_codon:yes stop_codon:yes gene_type:complete